MSRSGRTIEAPPAQESWFAALGVEQDTQIGEDRDSRIADWDTPPAEDSRFITRQARRLLSSGQPSFQRIYSAFLGARLTVGLLLFAVQLASVLLGTVTSTWALWACGAYAMATLVTWLLERAPAQAAQALQNPRLLRRQWLATIGMDVLVFGCFNLIAPRDGLNFVPLLVLPVLMSGVLTRRPVALALAATVSMLLFASAWLAAGRGGGDLSVLLAQAGLVGSGFFVVAILAGELAGRLAREERAARGSMELARQQAQLNRLVIEELQEGVMVVDRKGRVRTANPAARRLIAADVLAHPASFALHADAAWEPLADSVQKAFDEGSWPDAGRDLSLKFSSGKSRSLRMRMRFTRRRDPQQTEELCVLFLEDLRDVQARLRQEKLAAMGRVSAGIAHEIRNPLSAISQANALMAEDAVTPAHRQLTQMVADNVERLKRIVDDVMEVAPGGPAVTADVIDITSLVGSVCSEWARTVRLPLDGRSAMQVELPGFSLGSRFDAEHLRRVLINLLDNAYRHASGKPGSVEIRLSTDGSELVVLSVASDGGPIPPEVERYLFEPFFSTRSRGTGLGLYICKELCERYGATIDYRLRGAHFDARNEFFVLMRSEPMDIPVAGLNLAR